MDFGSILDGFLELFFYHFLNSLKNAAPHESAVNTNQIVGRAPCKNSEKASQNEQKNGMGTKTKK